MTHKLLWQQPYEHTYHEVFVLKRPKWSDSYGNNSQNFSSLFLPSVNYERGQMFVLINSRPLKAPQSRILQIPAPASKGKEVV